MSAFFQDIRRQKQAVPAFLALTLLYAASYFQRTAIPGTIFNELQESCGFSAAQVAGLGASFMYIYAIAQLFVGMLADKYSGMRVVAWAGFLFCSGALLFPLCGDKVLPMYLCRMLTGVGASSLYLSLVKETDRIFGRKNYSVILGIVYFVGYSGGLAGTLPFSALCGHFNWNTLLIWIGAVSFLLYFLFLIGRRTLPVPAPSPVRLSLRPMLRLFKNPYTWLLIFCSSVNFVTYFIIQTVFGKKFLQDFAGMSSNAASGAVFSLTLVSMFTLLGGGIVTRLLGNRRKPLMIFASGVALANTILMFCTVWFRLPAGMFVAGYCLYAFASGFSVVFSMSCQEVNSRDVLTQAAGVLNMCNYLAVAVFSVLIGILLDSFVNPSALREGAAVTYPPEAYATLFGLLLIPTVSSFLGSFFLPETKGHYLHLRSE